MVAENKKGASRRRGGFTLTEMLVVIGIIVALVALLIPAVGHVRRKGYDSGTRSTLMAIAKAVDTYYNTFNGYPGPAGLAQTTTNDSQLKVSGAQNLLIGLNYPMVADDVYDPTKVVQFPGTAQVARANGSASSIYLNPSEVRGPFNYAQSGTFGRYEPLQPFYPAATKHMTRPEGDDWSKLPFGGIVGAVSTYNQFRFPTLIDNYPDAMPILFYRRTPTVTAPVLMNPDNGPASFYISENDEYTTAQPLQSISGRTYNQLKATADDDAANANTPRDLTPQILQEAFRDSGGTARGGYILLSAGSDRYYGVYHDTAGKPTTTDIDNIVQIGGN